MRAVSRLRSETYGSGSPPLRWRTVYVEQSARQSEALCMVELSPACQKVRHTRAIATARPCELEVPRCQTSQFARWFLPAQCRMWSDLLSSGFDSG